MTKHLKQLPTDVESALRLICEQLGLGKECLMMRKLEMCILESKISGVDTRQ